jgi:L-asparaginase II
VEEYQPVLQITRGSIVESQHCGAIAIADHQGVVNAGLGNRSRLTFMRSSAKPFQALPLIENGAFDAFGLTSEDLALICASHSGTDDHLAAALRLAARGDLDETMLQCGTHPPIDPATARRLAAQGESPSPLRNNCSGKHLGMLILARHLGAPLDSYLEITHPVQALILRTMAEMCDCREADIGLGVDGCSAPNFAVPLHAAARAYARLADPHHLPPDRRKALNLISGAMTTHPDLVGGPDRLDTRLMQLAAGRLVSKGGAEGFQALGIRPGALGPNSTGLGLCLKIADGGERKGAMAAATLHALRSVGVLGGDELDQLADLARPKIRNLRGIVVGEIQPCFQLGLVEPGG